MSKAQSNELKVGSKSYTYFPLKQAGDLSKMPKSLKVLMENLLRHHDGEVVTQEDIDALAAWTKSGTIQREISYFPARVLMQDFTGVPGVVDLAAMRDAMADLGEDPEKINPLSPVDLVIDHSVMVDYAGTADSFKKNVDVEMERNQERYEFLKWGQGAFKNFRVVPPGTGICHQVNLEYLGQTVFTKDEGGKTYAYPDTLVGTDSHTTMINALSILGWGVGGIEAEAAMLGQPISMLVPDVVGFKLKGKLKEGITSTDLVLTITQMLRAHGVVGKFVEFFGPGLTGMSLETRATISNMAPEYGATCGYFPTDEETLRYLKFTGRSADQVALVEAYSKEQGFWNNEGDEPRFTDVLELDLSTVEPSLAGPKRPQDRILMKDMKTAFETTLKNEGGRTAKASSDVSGKDFKLEDGNIVIAAITSCTNTSNPMVLLGAGLVARKAREKGLNVKPWVKTSLAPGSQVVTDYLDAAGLTADLDALGFNLVGYGCTTCIGNSGPIAPELAEAVEKENLVVTSVLSGNRNFEGRISPHVRANYLASPPLVVAYAIAGTTHIDLTTEALGKDSSGNDVFLKDIWPSESEIRSALEKSLTPEMFAQRYSDVFAGPKEWQDIATSGGKQYTWQGKSTYIKKPSFFDGMTKNPEPLKDIEGARVLALLGDSITTDHISPAGAIKADSPAGEWLKANGVEKKDFNSFGSRRGNHEVMVRGTFGNIRIKNEMVGGKSGGFTQLMPDGAETTIFEAAEQYRAQNIPLVVVAGKEYGTGSSRDWAAKGTDLLGVKAVIAESYERIHRSNLIGMGVIPLEFPEGMSRKTLNLDGSEEFTIKNLDGSLAPKGTLSVDIKYKDGKTETVNLNVRVDTAKELEYVKNGGILQTVIRRLAKEG